MKQLITDNIEIFYIVTIILGAFMFTKVMKRFLSKILESNSKKLNVSPTNYSMLKNTLGVLVWGLAFLIMAYAVPQLKVMATALLAGAGFLAAALAFASQEAVSNIISGIFIIAFKPFRVGDLVEIDGANAGTVEDITLRHTIIKDFQNRRVVVPNASISKSVIINSHLVDEKICKHYVMSVSYDSDIDRVKKIIREEAEKHPLCIDNRSEEDKENEVPIVAVRTVALGDSSVDLRANIWTANASDAFTVQCDLNESIKKRFDTEGIEIPYPYRSVVIRNETTTDA
jgi:small conductance mechanosensitive channel